MLDSDGKVWPCSSCVGVAIRWQYISRMPVESNIVLAVKRMPWCMLNNRRGSGCEAARLWQVLSSCLPRLQTRQSRTPRTTAMIIQGLPFQHLIRTELELDAVQLMLIVPDHRDASTSPPLTVLSTLPESNPASLSPSSSLKRSSPLPLLLPLRLSVASNTICRRGMTSRITRSLMRSRSPSVCLFTVSSGRY